MPMPYPPECDTDAKKLQWCLAMEKKLYQKHNEAGSQYKAWLEGKPTYQQWQNFLASWFQPRHLRLSSEMVRLREALREKPIVEDPDEL